MAKQKGITVTVAGPAACGKTTIAEFVAKRLKALPLGYDVFIEQDGMLDPNDMESAHNYQYPKKPNWDARVRGVRILTETLE